MTRFKKNSKNLIKKADMIGDDKLTTDFAKGGRVNFRGGGCTNKGINKKAFGKNS